MSRFQEAVSTKLNEQQYDAGTNDATQIYNKMCTAIQHAIDTTLPDKTVTQGVQRKVSDKSKKLYAERALLDGQGTPEQYKEIQSNIKASGLADFNHWVSDWADVISKTNGRGDTKGIYKAVKVLGGKPQQPPSNITPDQGGKLLECAEDVAAAWKSFL